VPGGRRRDRARAPDPAVRRRARARAGAGRVAVRTGARRGAARPGARRVLHLPAPALGGGRTRVRVPERAAPLAPFLPGRPPRRCVGRTARRLCGRPAALGRRQWARLLALRARLDAAADGGREPHQPRLPRPLRRAHRDRVAPFRRALRPVRGTQPGAAVELTERRLAARIAPALRPRRLPVLPGARLARRASAPAHRDRLRQLDAAWPLHRPVGSLAVGGLRPAALDAVTLDAYGTLVELDNHVARLRHALAEAGVERDERQVEQAFLHEVEHYSRHKCTARDAATRA